MSFNNPPCAGETQLFYPDYLTPKGDRIRAEKKAQAICAGCRYQPECLEIGVNNEIYGIWGGANGKELKRIRKQRNIKLARNAQWIEDHPSCGSERGYQWTMLNGISCAECNQAHKNYVEGHRMPAGYEEPGAHPNCGTEKGYQMLARRCQANGGKAAGFTVTCPVCKRAHADRSSKLRQPKRATS